MEFTTSSLTALLIAFAYLNWIYLAWSNRETPGEQSARNLIIVLGLGFLVSLITAIPEDNDLLPDALPQPELVVFFAGLVLIAYGALTLSYFQFDRYTTPYLGLSGLWWLASTGLIIADDSVVIGSSNWISDINLAGLVMLGGWGVIGIVMVALSFYSFYKATLPEVANRALIWAVIIPVVTMGALLGITASGFLRELGWLFQVVGLALVTYGVSSVRALDIRQTVRWTVANAVIVLSTSLVILIILLIADGFDTSNVNQAVFFAALAISAALIYAPLLYVLQNISRRILLQRLDNVTPELRRFAEAITGVVEMDQLADVVMKTLRDLLGVRRGALLLIDEYDENYIELKAYPVNMGNVSEKEGFLHVEGMIYKRFVIERKSVLQFDLDFSPAYKNVPDTEKGYFKHLSMAAFAPIVANDKLMGLIASGPKSNDARFNDVDLEILGTIANQTGIALRNAGLLEDVLKRERDVAETNKRLEIAKRQLEALDSVKTDFITIASHELRTPLAQIRGHTDIIQALNEQGMMDQEQLASLTGNLRRAADRLEGLIGDMLDVSQLDLSAMDLRFATTTVESAVRLAVEPLQESIRNRKQSLTARGLRGLPEIEADMQRLVQAIRNIVLNAVKFTPDGGRIDIIGKQIKNEITDEDEVQIMIRDTGIGIDKKNHEAIFEKFFRAFDPGLHSTGKTKFMGAGPGLGLTIAQGVIEGHGGRIWVESKTFDPDELPGATFYIVLPVVPPKGARRVLPISSSSSNFSGETKMKPPASNGETGSIDTSSDDTDENKPFEEKNPTILNPSANRAGMTTALKAAAEEAKRLEAEQEAEKDEK